MYILISILIVHIGEIMYNIYRIINIIVLGIVLNVAVILSKCSCACLIICAFNIFPFSVVKNEDNEYGA